MCIEVGVGVVTGLLQGVWAILSWAGGIREPRVDVCVKLILTLLTLCNQNQSQQYVKSRKNCNLVNLSSYNAAILTY